MGIDNYNVYCGGCLSWGSSPGAPQGLGVGREAACWKVRGRWGLVSECTGGRKVCSGPSQRDTAAAAGVWGEITLGYVSWRAGRPHHQEGPDSFIYLLSSPDSFRKYPLVQEQKPQAWWARDSCLLSWAGPGGQEEADPEGRSLSCSFRGRLPPLLIMK